MKPASRGVISSVPVLGRGDPCPGPVKYACAHIGEQKVFSPFDLEGKCAKGWVTDEKTTTQIGNQYHVPNELVFSPTRKSQYVKKHQNKIFEVELFVCFWQFFCEFWIGSNMWLKHELSLQAVRVV